MSNLNKNDQRFLKEWEYQTGGSKAGYFILNAVIWSIMFGLFRTAANYVASEFRAKNFPRVMEIIYIIAIGILFAAVVYFRNQNRYLAIRLKKAEGDGRQPITDNR
jgi:preprotein translocase subunit SecY